MRIFISLSFFIISFLSASTLTLDNSSEVFDNFTLNYKIERSSQDIEDISKQKFTDSTKNSFNLGYIDGTLWIKLEIENKSQTSEFILTLNEVFYEKANLYTYDRGWRVEKNGIFTPIKDRDIKDNKLSFKLSIPRGATKTYFIELSGKYAYFGDVEIIKEDAFIFTKLTGVDTLYYFILGVLAITATFSFFMFLQLKERIYIYYTGYSFSLLVYIFNVSGLFVYYGLNEYIYKFFVFAPLTVAFLVLFSVEFLDVRKFFPSFVWFSKLLYLPLFALAIVLMFEFQPWNAIMNSYANTSSLILLAVAMIVYKRGHKKSRYYLIAVVFQLIFIAIFSGMVAGFLEYNDITRYGLGIVSSIEAILFSFLLANRYKDIKEQNELRLEQMVAFRTKELEESNKNLKELLEERSLLLKELYHRVKNNFHMITGLLWLESNKIVSEKETFNNIINRIKSFSLINEHLYRSKNVSKIKLKEYIESIAKNILQVYKDRDVKTHFDIDDMVLSFDEATSLGIIINEALTNTLKHNSYIDNLTIELKAQKDGRMITLEVIDNGHGFDSDEDRDGLGLKLMEQFAGKLEKSNFTIESSSSGTRCRLFFEAGV